MATETIANDTTPLLHEYSNQIHKNIEEALTKLTASITVVRPKEPPDQQSVVTPQRGWSLPPSVTTPPLGIKPWAIPRLRLEPPRFDGENAPDWICKIQKYYNHQYTTLDDRLYLTQYLFDHPASDWREYWLETITGKSWDDFLLAVEQRFDPDFYEPYAATASSGLSMGTRRTSCDQRKPNRPTANSVTNWEPVGPPPQRNEEVTQVSVVNLSGAHTANADSSNYFANGSGSKTIICDGSSDMINIYVDIVAKEHDGSNIDCAFADIDSMDDSEALHMASESIASNDNESLRYEVEQAAQVQALTEPMLPRGGSRDPVDKEVASKGVTPDFDAQRGVSLAIVSSSFNPNSLWETDEEEEVQTTWDPGASVGDSCFETIEEHNDEIVIDKRESDNSKVRENMRANGGLREDNFPLITDGGIATETYYPYTSIAATCAIYLHLARVVSIDLHDDDAVTKGIVNQMNNKKEGQPCDSRWVNPSTPPSLDQSFDVDSMIAALEEFIEIPTSCLLCIGLDHVVHLTKGSMSSHKDHLHISHCKLNLRLGYCLLSRKLLGSKQLVYLMRKIKFDAGAVDFDDSISTDVSSCESNIFCGNDGNLVANTPFVEKKVLEFNVLDVCFDGAEGHKVENGIQDLVVCDSEGLKDCCNGDFLERPKFLDGELHDSVGEASMSTLGGILVERQCCQLTRLLPITLEELARDKQQASTGPSHEVTANYSRKWPTSIHLTGPATGAVLNISIGFSIFDCCSLEPGYFAKIPESAKEGGLDHLFCCDSSKKCYFNNLGSVPLISFGGCLSTLTIPTFGITNLCL